MNFLYGLLAFLSGVLFKLFDDISDVPEVQQFFGLNATELIKVTLIGFLTILSLYDVTYLVVLIAISVGFWTADKFLYNETLPYEHKGIDEPFWWAGLAYIGILAVYTFITDPTPYYNLLDLSYAKNILLFSNIILGVIACHAESYLFPEETSTLKTLTRVSALPLFVVLIAYGLFDNVHIYEGMTLTYMTGLAYTVTSVAIKIILLNSSDGVNEKSYLLEKLYSFLQ